MGPGPWTSLALSIVVGIAVAPQAALANLPNRAPVPDPGPCDIVLTPADAPDLETLLNDPSLRVFCAEPGDYRSSGMVRVTASGTESARRTLRLLSSEPVPRAIQQQDQALFESLKIRGSWWVIQGITLQPSTDPLSHCFLEIQGGDHNVAEGILADGIDYLAQGLHAAVCITPLWGDPATRNVIRSSVLRRGNQQRLGVDYNGFILFAGELGENNDFNQLLDTEIYDWGNGVTLQAKGEACDGVGQARGTILDGNDIYLTPDKRANCDGSPNPTGDCACAEEAIDIKHDPGPDPEHWTRVTNNRVWGFRPTSEPSCGGSGSSGAAIQTGGSCAAHLLVAGNVVLDAAVGVKPSTARWVLAGNLLHGVRRGIFPTKNARQLEIEFNTIVDAWHAYDDAAADTTARCNAVIDDLGANGRGNPTGEGHEAEYNYLYAASSTNFAGTTNESFVTAEESVNQQFCFQRRRWTGPEEVCIPLARPTGASPHAGAAGACQGEAVARFGLAPRGFAAPLAVPEPRAGVGGAVALALGWLARAASRRRR